MWQPKDQRPLCIYQASHHGLLLETMVINKPIISEICNERMCLKNFSNPSIRLDQPKKGYSGFDTKLHMMMRLQSWRYEEFGGPFIAITPRSTLTLSGSTC